MRRAQRRPHVLLGWLGEDGLPLVAPVRAAGADERAVLLDPTDLYTGYDCARVRTLDELADRLAADESNTGVPIA